MKADPNGPLALVLQSMMDVALPLALVAVAAAAAITLARKFK